MAVNKMIRIEYDSERGAVLPDNKIEAWANGLKNGDEVIVGSELMILAVRVAIFKKLLNFEKVVFIFKGEEIIPDKNGRISFWPEGFCDIGDKLLDEIIMW